MLVVSPPCLWHLSVTESSVVLSPQRVVANSRSITTSTNPDVLTVPGDISKPETARKIVEQGLSQFGRIDSLVSNAGIFIGKKFTDYTEADLSNMLAVNLAGFSKAPSLSLAGFRLVIADHAMGLPVLRTLSLCTCCRHYPCAAADLR